MTSRLALATLLVLLAMSVGIAGAYLHPQAPRQVMARLGLMPDDAAHSVPTPPPARPVATIEPTPRDEVLVVPLPEDAGDVLIASVAVSKGEAVSEGQILVVLDTRPQLEAAVFAARAELNAREAALERTRNAVRGGLEEERAALARAEARARAVRREFERMSSLRARRIVAQFDLDRASEKHETAKREVAQAVAALERSSPPDLDQQDDVLLALRSVESARADLVLAEAEVEWSLVRAPRAGIVLQVHARAGEPAGEHGLVSLASIDTRRD